MLWLLAEIPEVIYYACRVFTYPGYVLARIGVSLRLARNGNAHFHGVAQAWLAAIEDYTAALVLLRLAIDCHVDDAEVCALHDTYRRELRTVRERLARVLGQGAA